LLLRNSTTCKHLAGGGNAWTLATLGEYPILNEVGNALATRPADYLTTNVQRAALCGNREPRAQLKRGGSLNRYPLHLDAEFR
jgi:hypothetical protein